MTPATDCQGRGDIINSRQQGAEFTLLDVLVLTFAGLSLGLAMVGLFGVIAYSVEQRVRDFGVRSGRPRRTC